MTSEEILKLIQKTSKVRYIFGADCDECRVVCIYHQDRGYFLTAAFGVDDELFKARGPFPSAEAVRALVELRGGTILSTHKENHE